MGDAVWKKKFLLAPYGCLTYLILSSEQRKVRHLSVLCTLKYRHPELMLIQILILILPLAPKRL